MAKRFVDTGMFDDEWFMELSPEAKILWFYYITKCDHAGILKANEKLIKFQTGIKSPATVIKELGNRIVTVTENVYFCPAFLRFQYPNFPNSKVQQQDGALKILISYGLWNKELNSLQTVGQQLPNCYDNVSDSVNGICSEEKRGMQGGDASVVQKHGKNKANIAEIIDTGQKELHASIVSYMEQHPKQYPKTLYRAFYDWWSEPFVEPTPKLAIKKDSMKTWSLAGRLRTWYKKEEVKYDTDLAEELRSASLAPMTREQADNLMATVNFTPPKLYE
jgi:hypothetical protein